MVPVLESAALVTVMDSDHIGQRRSSAWTDAHNDMAHVEGDLRFASNACSSGMATA